MATEFMDYPDDGTLEDLGRTCGADEDICRGPLTKLERVEDESGKKGIRATYAPIPAGQKYVKRKLFIFDVTDLTPQQQVDLTARQVAKGNARIFEGEVYLGGKPATVAVYRKKL